MSNLTDVEWKGGEGLEEVWIWGSKRIAKLASVAEAIEMQTFFDHEEIASFFWTIQEIANDMTATLERFFDEVVLGKKADAPSAPAATEDDLQKAIDEYGDRYQGALKIFTTAIDHMNHKHAELEARVEELEKAAEEVTE